MKIYNEMNIFIGLMCIIQIGSFFTKGESLFNASEKIFLNEVVTDSSLESATFLKLPLVEENFNNSSGILVESNIRHSTLNDPKISSQLYSRRKMDECWKEGECEPLEDNTCLGVTLPYTHTSRSLSKLPSQRAAREALESVTSALRNVPHCWSVVQPFLCAVLFPQCNESSVQLPSIEMCAITRGPCRLYDKEIGWPDFLLCQEEYPPKCKTASRELHFNTTGVCAPPLVNTSNEALWVDGIRGCGVQCSDPLFTPEEHEDLQSFIAMLGGICLACSAFTVLTYLIDWRWASKYPALIIFYMNGCFLITSIGFMVQFYGDVRQHVTCYSDGTLRNSEPSSGGNLSCVVVFVCVYYFMIAAEMWLVILGYAWHCSFKSLAAGQCQQSLERKAAYFHLISWSIPLIFTIGVISSAGVKADSAFGVCFLSAELPVRVGALLVPVTLAICVGAVFLVGSLKSLVRMKLNCSNIISDHANKKIVETIVRLGLFIVALFSFLIITLYCHVYIFLNQEEWKQSLRNYILCMTGIKYEGTECQMLSRPSINLYKLNLMALFGTGIIMASWCWTTNTVEAWQRFLRRVVGVVDDEPARLTKHKLIAEAFAKRNDLNNVGRLSISLRSLHSDPVGLNFEVNSATSCDVSSVWAAAIPHLMTRRGGFSRSTPFVLRRNSVDSQYSINRRFSIESSARRQRRHSLDSQLSFHVSDVERFAAMRTAARFGASGRQRHGRRDWFSLRRARRRKGRAFEPRNSTSDESNMGSMVLPTLTLSTNDSLFTSMMKRLNISTEHVSQLGVSQRLRRSLSATSPFRHLADSNEDVAANGASAFSRKYNGFKRREKENGLKSVLSDRYKPKNRSDKGNNEVVKASVGIQTSLESLSQNTLITHDKACQVSTPLLQKHKSTTNHTVYTTTSSPSGSLTSLSDQHNGKNSEDKGFLPFKTPPKKTYWDTRRSLPPVSLPLKKSATSSSVKKNRKKRSWSENETNHCIVDLNAE